MRVDKNGNKEYLDDGETVNPEFDAGNVESAASGKDTEELINRLVEERLAKIKSSLDKAYQERDSAVKEKVRLEEEKKQARMKSLEEEGKHKEVAEMKLAELQEKLAISERKVTELSRDRAVKDALTGLEFRNERSNQMAYRDIVDQLVQDPETGAWIHKSGVSIKDYVSQYAKNEDNSFLFRAKTNSGTGAGNIDGAPKFNSNKKISEMSTQEILQLAESGKLGSFNL